MYKFSRCPIRLSSSLAYCSLLLLFCRKEVEVVVNKVIPNCQLKTLFTSFGNVKIYESFYYDSLNREKKNITITIDDNPRRAAKDTTVCDNLYNADGYLVLQKCITHSTIRTRSYVAVSEFQYSGGILKKKATSVESPKFTHTYSYEYDNDGHLVRLLTTGQDYESSRNFAYTNNKLSDYYTVSIAGEVDRQYIYKNGLPFETVYTDLDNKDEFIYDNKDRLVRYNVFYKSKLTEYTEYSYLSVKYPSTIRYYPKGWPREIYSEFAGFNVEQDVRNELTQYKYNAQLGGYYRSYWQTSKYKTNDKNMPIETVSNYLSFNSSGSVVQSGNDSHFITYNDCK